MQVDTGEFRALSEQAAGMAALSRKVSTLTGRVTVMGNHVNRMDDALEDDVRGLLRITVSLMEYSGLMPRKPREPGRHAVPKRERHLRVVDGGER